MNVGKRIVQGLVVFVCAFVLYAAHEATAKYPLPPSSVVQGLEVHTRLDTVRVYASCYGRSMLILPYWQVSTGYREDSLGQAVEWTARTWVNMMYRRAWIEIDSVQLAAAPDSIVRQVVVHELAHLASWPLVLLAEQADSVQGRATSEGFAAFVERWPIWQTICVWPAEGGSGA